jgi:hypothetical protein
MILGNGLRSHVCGLWETNVTPLDSTIPEARRLEQIRLEYLDGMPLAEFHRLLTDTGDYRVSYAGVRNYHTTRKAPVDYYAQVSRVFGIRLEWLLFGAGAMTESAHDTSATPPETQEFRDALRDLAPTAWDAHDPVTQAAFLDCIRRLDLARPGARPLSAKEKEDLARVLDTLVAGTLWILRGDRDVPPHFVRSILLSLTLGIPGPKRGSTFRGIMKRMKLGDGS